MPELRTERLIVRPFRMDDLYAVHDLLDRDLAWTSGDEGTHTLEQRRTWLEWTVSNERELGNMFQPPYGDRAVTLHDGTLVGVTGYVPELKPFHQIPWFRGEGPNGGADGGSGRNTAEIGLYWATGTAWQRRGFAAEAARALIDYGFGPLNLARVVATTEYENAASIGVMRRIGMRIERNPLPDPFYFQVVGVIEHLDSAAA